MPDKKMCIAREMTKMHEEFIRGTCKDVYEKVKDKNLKGEIVVVLSD
jgi:16S rRNA (cytidine1402-2'-O)-methyltransferase